MSIRTITERNFASGKKLDVDYLNVWTSLRNRLELIKRDSLDFQSLPPALHYEKYLQQYPEDVEYIMKLSDPEAVAAMDRLVDEYNADLERIRREKDFVAVGGFVARAIKIVDGEK